MLTSSSVLPWCLVTRELRFTELLDEEEVVQSDGCDENCGRKEWIHSENLWWLNSLIPSFTEQVRQEDL